MSTAKQARELAIQLSGTPKPDWADVIAQALVVARRDELEKVASTLEQAANITGEGPRGSLRAMAKSLRRAEEP